jgi:hypothetical protein
MSNPVWDDFSNSYKENVKNKKVDDLQRCLICGKVVDLPRRCTYCKGVYCDEHRLPELHNCTMSSRRGWVAYKALKMGDSDNQQEKLKTSPHEKSSPLNKQHDKEANNDHPNQKETQDDADIDSPVEKTAPFDYEEQTDRKTSSPEQSNKNENPMKNIRSKWSKARNWLELNQYKINKIKLKSNYVYLILWVICFLSGLYIIPTGNILFLIIVSLFNAAILSIYIYGILGIRKWKFERKLFSVFLILLTIGTIYQNPSIITDFNSNSVKNLIIFEYSYLSSIITSIFGNSLANTGIYTIIPSLKPLFINVKVIDENLKSGISGLHINLLYSNGSIVLSQITNNTGYTSFQNIPVGLYKVQVVLPEGYISSYDTTNSVNTSGDTTFKVENLLIEPKTIQLKYTLRGVTSTIPFTVYGGLENYLSTHPNSTITYSSTSSSPSSSEVSSTVHLRYVNERVEKSEVMKLSEAIQKITLNKDDQARIAISLVQNIPYDYDQLNYGSFWRYPYEVLYNNAGICSQKSMLLVCLLRNLGFGCALLNFDDQNHEAVGIVAPSQYAYTQGYAFIEASAPSIITDWHSDYFGNVKLPSSPSEIITISSGQSMNSISEEYNDSQLYRTLINKGLILSAGDYNQWLSLSKKYGLPTS